MDKKWQDIYYVDTSKPECIPDLYYTFAIRQIHIINIAFGDEDIVIFYKNYNEEYHWKILKKEMYHKLLIE